MTDLPHLSPDMALFLDFDGTLVEIAPSPEMVAVRPETIVYLQRQLEELEGALAVVSGRPIMEIDHFLAPLQLAAAGLHGLEHRYRAGGELRRDPPGAEILQLKQEISASGLLGNGVFLEDKGVAVAVHFRAAPDKAGEITDFLETQIRSLPDLHLLQGKMVVEAKPDTQDKGKAVAGFLDLDAFRDRLPVFLGDDVTDEDGMAAVQAAGGFGIKVGEGDTCAQFRLADVAAVHRWLAGQ
ncbi:trehalose-phosphatase [Roseibium sp. RKSG952]|uniref:trehalose-phosphatase n=1 Tax=Roseibium sp. RKSG952 TaxID=2529384 RepID=UPI0012BC5E06|nr:trehalose-phosphatase [Roseibium sp. RKSG952]MTH96214.1 trehalose-phosphatase [Roseibium sp. RKSG952]